MIVILRGKVLETANKQNETGQSGRGVSNTQPSIQGENKQRLLPSPQMEEYSRRDQRSTAPGRLAFTWTDTLSALAAWVFGGR